MVLFYLFIFFKGWAIVSAVFFLKKKKKIRGLFLPTLLNLDHCHFLNGTGKDEYITGKAALEYMYYVFIWAVAI